MRRESIIVKPEDVRPARPDGCCFYCKAPIGQEHAKGCLIRTRTIVVDVVMRLVRVVPEDWDERAIDYHMNHGTWCRSNLINEIESVETDDRCLCDRTICLFAGEATKEDEERYGVCQFK